ncbi:MAG: hypothetical protein Hyperionvirus27_25 [Hyperionvirus sp.]|uniref:Uncharacterized protein n=1 Tax=Hyperionvirus sp. TaxID=2487770 RepID=A0A3G5AB93_9VIRU|nr:MAG: hypothetical protein Hyperionvirus27_25 [Hyperionvirus sp.]
MSSKTGRRSDYSYGRTKELTHGRLVQNHVNGTEIKRTPGSRGPADVTVYKNGSPTYDIQSKSSRASSQSSNTVSQRDISKLISHSKERGTVPLIAESKGNHGVIRYAVSGRKMISY